LASGWFFGCFGGGVAMSNVDRTTDGQCGIRYLTRHISAHFSRGKHDSPVQHGTNI
jgi:hypothetical protein